MCRYLPCQDVEEPGGVLVKICHQQFLAADELLVLLFGDGLQGDFRAFGHVHAVGLTRVHLGEFFPGGEQCALGYLRADTARDEEGHLDVGVFQLQGLVESEEGVLGGAVGRAERESEEASGAGIRRGRRWRWSLRCVSPWRPSGAP